MKKFCFFNPVFQAFLLVLIFIIEVQAQESKGVDLVQVKVVASGNTEASAVTEALRSALTQTSSVFISSNTTLINDELAKDQISMINNGSIAKYEIVEKAIKEDGTVFLTCNVTVSVNKLGSFVESAGGSTELKGGLFATNIKLMELNERAEETSVRELLKVSRQLLANCFDYSITNGEPIASGQNWSVPLKVVIKKNLNYDEFCRFFYYTLESIGMSSNEVETYQRLKKPICVIGLFNNMETKEPTPVLRLSKDPLFKSTNYSYYVRGCHEMAPDSLRHYTLSELSKLNYNRQRELLRGVPLMQRDYYLKEYYRQRMCNYTTHEFNFYDDVYTTNSQGKYTSIVFRSKTSIMAIERFLYDYSKIIQNAVINNGLQAINLNEINSTGSNYELVKVVPDIPIAFNYFGADFLEDFRIRIPNGLLGNPEQIKMQGWLFDIVFANYVKYTYDLEKFTRHGQVTRSFPAQLSIIGDESKIVYVIELLNEVSLEEISKISKYTIKSL